MRDSNDDCGLTVSVDYATQRRALVREFTKKPIKNSELGGSGDTCIDGTRQSRSDIASLT
jgi:hypothetical protein